MSRNDDLTWARSKLLRWFRLNVRSYPWRNTSNPYHVLVAEMMLQRTRADQVKPVYEKFVHAYPDIQSTAKASLRELKGLLWPLGLHGRAVVFRQMARDVSEMFRGEVPADRHQLLRITGVGEYIAGAVLSFAFGSREWIVDANVVRVLTRFTGLAPSRGEPRRSQAMIKLAQEYCRTRSSRSANLALLDHAALICRPQSPSCDVCPLRQRCAFLKKRSRVKS